MYCDQRYADWPASLDAAPFTQPDMVLLSYGAGVTASSGTGAQNAADEDINTVWRAGSNAPGEWIALDLGSVCDVMAVQVNFGDDRLELTLPEGAQAIQSYLDSRWIDMRRHVTQWKLEGSADGEHWITLADKSEAETDLSHDFIEWDAPAALRFVKLTIYEVPYDAVPCVSGLRVFGHGHGAAPQQASVTAAAAGDLDMDICWSAPDADGANILWGYAPEKLYHSCTVYGKTSRRIGALIKGEPVYVRVDVFNQNGITEGEVQTVRA